MLDTQVAQLFATYPRLLQLMSEPTSNGAALHVWYAQDGHEPSDDPTTWLSDACDLDDLPDMGGSSKADLDAFRSLCGALDVTTIWYRPAAVVS